VQQQNIATGAESVHWDLSDLYTDVDDPRIDTDLEQLIALAQRFHADHAGKLAATLGAALAAQAEIQSRADKLMIYLFLRRSTDAGNQKIQQRLGSVQEAWSQASADYLTFFDHELVAIDDATYAAALARDPIAARHAPLLDHIRANRGYLLAENVERALTLRDPFGPSEWSDYIDEIESELRFSFDGRELTLPEILHVVSNDRDGGQRSKALASFGNGLREQRFDRLMARTLNVVLGAKYVEDRERGYANPMSARNIGNRVDDDTVTALHEAVATNGAAQARRYYRLLAAHLKQKTLAWSDRNAPLPYSDDAIVPWSDCVETVLSAYGSFSPTLRDLVARMLDRKWVDAPPYPGKTGGAFNYAVLLPGDDARAYNFLNYLGSPRDIMTVAHEAGHGVHGILAAKAQGSLMFRAPMVYAETASIFGEMTTFKYLLEQSRSDEHQLSLLMGKAADHINTVVRQISFSNFERRTHEARRSSKLTVDDYDRAWMDVTHEFYGAPGELFTYDAVEPLWCYVTHFLRPFYVYAYAFGELFTQSLFARKDDFGKKFEPMYLDLLRAGGSRDAVELMAPFGLDPRDPEFWKRGIDASVARWLDEAEALSAKMGVRVSGAES